MNRRGCRKPGQARTQTGPPYVFSSPILQGAADRVLRECPTGKILRETPHVYDLIEVAAATERAGPGELVGLPMPVKHAARLYWSERSRHLEIRASRARATSDAAYATRVVR